MKNTLYFFTTILLLTFAGCDTKRESIGGDDEIIVIVSPETEETMRNILSQIFTDTVYTPKPEPIYTLKFAHPDGFADLKRQSNLVIGSIGNNLLNPGTKLLNSLLGDEKFSETISNGQHIFFTRDQFAQNQLLLIVSAESIDDLQSELKGKADWIRETFDDKYDSRQSKYLFNNARQKKLEKQLLNHYQWSVNIPWGWELIKENPDSQFVWLGKEMPYQWISVHWEDGIVTEDKSSATEKLQEYPEKYYHSIRTNDYKFSVSEFDFNHWAGWKATGIWESVDEAKGGPFISYLFYDGVTDRTYFIHMIVYYPQKEKTVFLHQLDLIAKSFQVEE